MLIWLCRSSSFFFYKVIACIILFWFLLSLLQVDRSDFINLIVQYKCNFLDKQVNYILSNFEESLNLTTNTPIFQLTMTNTSTFQMTTLKMMTVQTTTFQTITTFEEKYFSTVLLIFRRRKKFLIIRFQPWWESSVGGWGAPGPHMQVTTTLQTLSITICVNDIFSYKVLHKRH